MRTALRTIALVLFVMVAAGCQLAPAANPNPVTVTAPKTVNQALADAEIAFTGTVVAIDQMYTSKVITLDQARAFMPTLQKISDALDAAEAAAALGNAAAEQAQINGATALLSTISGALLALRSNVQ